MLQGPHKSQKKIEALRDSEARFKATFENAAVGIARVALDGLWLEVNQRLCDIVGYTRKEMMTKTFSDITHPDDLESDWNQARRLLAGEFEHYSMEKRYYHKDGSVVWVNVTISLARKADGSPDYFVTVVEDISARKRAEEAMRESVQRFTQFMQHLPGLAWIKDMQGRYVYANATAMKVFRTSMEQLYGKTDDEIFPPEIAARFKYNDRQALSNEEGVFVVETLEHEDGVLHYSAVRKFPIPGHDVSETKIGGIAIDITESKNADEALRESEERLVGIVSSAMDAIITVDEDQRIILFNEAAEQMFDCPAAESLGQSINRFIPDRFRGAVAERFRSDGEAGGVSRAMGRLDAITALRPDGAEFPIEASISTVDVGGRKLYTVILRDVTELKQAEAEREQLAREQVARASAEAANRSKDEFLAMVSHELRSPLNAILGFSRMLRFGPLDRDAINKVIAIIERSAKAQLQIIEDLLDSARIITGKLRIELEPVDLAPLLEAALDTVRPMAEAKEISLAANFGPTPEETLGDSTRLQQVVWNLLTNAVKFTSEGGRVELRMESDADNIHITVSDTGKGIEPELLPFIFDPLRQADSSSVRRYGGLGLGLSLVKHLVELHGGTITAVSEGSGRGSTFTVTLPRLQLKFTAPPTPAITPSEVRTEGAILLDHSLSLDGVSVLVVDDQEEARVILTQTLRAYGAQVTAVSSGAEALAFLSHPPEGKSPDTLILDIAMPDEDGYTVLKKVRNLEAERGCTDDQIPAIALTVYGRSEDRLRALQAGFHMHVAKPVEPAELAVAIANLMIRRVWEREMDRPVSPADRRRERD